jgi:hypothetical protein
MVCKNKTQKRRKQLGKKNKKSMKRMKGGGSDNNDSCVICLEKLDIDIGISTYPISVCSNNHKFHLYCIKTYLQKQLENGYDYVCPICKAIFDENIINKISLYSEKEKELYDLIDNSDKNEAYQPDFEE